MFVLFGKETRYYASGGWHDYRGTYQYLSDAVAAALDDCPPPEWWHIVDIRTGAIACGSKDQPYGAPDIPENLVIRSTQNDA